MAMVRVRVPLVRPLVRCTFKRLLRVLPSVLLLLFVFSLIFVTLMQIAVIHSHRRGHYAPARHDPLNATPPAPTGYTVLGVSGLQMSSSAATRAAVPPVGGRQQRSDALRVEAFLDKGAPTLEANAAIMRNVLHCARVRRILQALGRDRTPLDGARGRVLVIPRGGLCCGGNGTGDGPLKKREACPLVPRLEGRQRLELDFRDEGRLEAELERGGGAYARGRGGAWGPVRCAPRHSVALVIPYRDRREHLTTLLRALHPLLRRQTLEYRVYVVEQFGNATFNKGVLMNAGAREAARDRPFHCLLFHDVDMLPEDDRNLYSCPASPRHLSVAVDKFNYTLPYAMLVGGVFAIRLEHFVAVNGYSNLYWGWGGEDDDMAYRIKYRKLEIVRPPEMLARYTMIKHEHRPESPNAIRTALLRMAKKRSSRDGLNTAKYRVLWRHDHPSHTHLMVDIGKHHRWQFLNGQRLIINF